MAATVEGMIPYGYLGDDTFDEGVAQLCLTAAKAYLVNAGVAEPTQDNSLYDLCCYMLAMHWYDNRGVEQTGNQTPIPYGVQSIVLQLQQ